MTKHPYDLRLLVIFSALCICCNAAPLLAGIITVGDVSPADPSLWDNTTNAYLAQTSNGSVTINSDTAILSRFAFIGYASGLMGEFTVDGPGSTWTNSSRLYVGSAGNGALNVVHGGTVNNDFGCLGYIAGSTGTAKVDGKDSTWTNSSDLYVGFYGNGRLEVTAGGALSNFSGFIGYDIYDQPVSIGTGIITVDGSKSKWTNNSNLFVGYSGKGTLNIAGGGAVTATNVAVNSQSLLAIDVGNGSHLTINDGTGAITNNGTVRILAGAGAAANIPYLPIITDTWGGGTYQPIGGTWNAADHTFTASLAQTGSSGNPLTIDLKNIQRLLINDSLGASFAPTASDTSLDFTATTLSGQPLIDLLGLIGANQSVLAGWQLTATGGYAPGDPAYLSFNIGPDLSRNDITVWHYNGTTWSQFDATDLTMNGGYASFTVTGFSGYALSAVPEPGALILLASGLLSMFFYIRRRLL